jgi:hypothetical protein
MFVNIGQWSVQGLSVNIAKRNVTTGLFGLLS